MRKRALPPKTPDIKRKGFHLMCRHNKFILRAVWAALLMVMLPVACFAEFKQGDKLPDLGSFKLEGKLPEELTGRVILLDFWASWCGPCKSSFPVMEELKTKYADRGLTIVAVSVDKKQENVERFLKTVKVSFTVVRDAQQKLVAAANVRAMPTS